MAFLVDNKGNITLVQGDSGELIITGIPTNHDYECFLSFYNSARKTISDQIKVNSLQSDKVTFFIPATTTDELKVKNNEETAEYFYGVKICHKDEFGYDHEDTLVIGDTDIGDLNTVTVYPKKVEGV